MDLATDGPLLLSLDAAKRILAATAAWTELGGAERIYFDALPPPSPGPDYSRQELIQLRPFALIWHDVSGGYRMEAASADLRCPAQSGKIIVQFEVNTPDDVQNDPTALAIQMNRLIGNLLRTGNPSSPGLWDLAWQPGYLAIRAIEVDGYVRTDDKQIAEVGDAICFEFAITWGNRAI